MEYTETRLTKLEKEGWTGPDLDLNESLFEYGFAWKKIDSDTYDYIYRVELLTESEPLFDQSVLDNDFLNDLDWVDLAAVVEINGLTEKQWLKQDIPYKIYDLYCYYGYLDVFGENYYAIPFIVTD